MTQEPFTSHLELTSDAEQISRELEKKQEEPLRLILGEDIYAELEGIKSHSKTIYFKGDPTEETREYLEQRGLQLEEYEEKFRDTAELSSKHNIKIETPTDNAFFQSIEEDIYSEYREK